MYGSLRSLVSTFSRCIQPCGSKPKIARIMPAPQFNQICRTVLSAVFRIKRRIVLGAKLQSEKILCCPDVNVGLVPLLSQDHSRDTCLAVVGAPLMKM